MTEAVGLRHHDDRADAVGHETQTVTARGCARAVTAVVTRAAPAARGGACRSCATCASAGAAPDRRALLARGQSL